MPNAAWCHREELQNTKEGQFTRACTPMEGGGRGYYVLHVSPAQHGPCKHCLHG